MRKTDQFTFVLTSNCGILWVYIFDENERLASWGIKTLNGQHEGSVSGTEIVVVVRSLSHVQLLN